MSKNLFNSIQVRKPNRNVFNLTHDVKLSCNMGELIPVMVMDCVPGDKVTINCETLVRFAPMVAPIMHRIDVFTHYFFVPNRLLWDNWENWITMTKVGGAIPAHPFMSSATNIGGLTQGNLSDYLGVPPGSAVVQTFNVMPFSAYHFIFNEYYRDQNIYGAGAEVNYKLVDGDNIGNFNTLTALRKRAWMHDYFTSCLPFAQKGDQVLMPLSGDVTLKSATGVAGQLRNASAHATIAGAVTGDGAGDLNVNATDSVYDPNGTLEIATATTTINDFRRALKLQEFLERNARGGTRLTEFNFAHYGVKGSDARLQRPEYITGSKSPVMISEVLNTTGTTGQLPQGNMSGHGISAGRGHYGKYFCEEHGYIIGIMSVMPKTAYQDGFPKHFLKYGDATQIYFPEFANIGEQPVENREVYADNNVNPTAAFGYVPRYSEYKFLNSRVAGEFRSTLNHWHEGRIFSGIPSLNETFITCDPSHRIFAVTDPNVDKLYVHHLNKVIANRLMPKYGTPSI